MPLKGPTDLPWAALFEAQIRANSRLFFHLANGILRNGGDAEEICQQAFLRAWEHRSTLTTPAALKSWIWRMVMNESLQLLRRRKIEKRFARDHAAVKSQQAEESRALDRNEAILLAMQKLPEIQRNVVILRKLQDLSGNQVSEMLGCSQSEVSKHLHQGLEQLRVILADWSDDSSFS